MLVAAFDYNSNQEMHSCIKIPIKLQFIVILIKFCAFDGLNCNN